MNRTLDRHCYGDDCHCDWRLTLSGCEESVAIFVVNYIHIGISTLVSLIGMGIVYHRVIIRGYMPLEIKSGKGLLRPKPVECMMIFLTIFNLLRLVNSVLLVADVAPDNMVLRSFIFEFPWQAGFAAFALYLLGVAQAMVDTVKMSEAWLPSPRIVDIIGLEILLAPFITNNIMSILAGVYASSNLYAAEMLTRFLYLFWFIHCLSLTTATIYSGVRLLRILNRNLAKFQPTSAHYAKAKTGIFKIRAVMVLICICLFSFAFLLFLYGVLRDMIIQNSPGSIFLCVIWNFLAAITTLFVEIAIIFNPSTENSNSKLMPKDSNAEKTDAFAATLSLNAFEFKKPQKAGASELLHPIDEAMMNYKGSVPIPQEEYDSKPDDQEVGHQVHSSRIGLNRA